MILNRQSKVRVAIRPLGAFLRRVQRELRLQKMEVAVAFVSDEEIARWNRDYRGKQGPTDVLSFPAVTQWRTHHPPETRALVQPLDHPGNFLGDIAIAPETAQRYAKKNGRTLAAELRVLLLHGVLHLMGYDHESDTGQMNRIEQKLRRKLGIARAAQTRSRVSDRN